MNIEGKLISIGRKIKHWNNSRNQIAITDIKKIESLILNRALYMAESKKVNTSMKSFDWKLRILEIINWRKSQKRKLYHFPKAFLFTGLTEYAILKNNDNLTKRISELFEFYINPDGTPAFTFNIVDQVPFATASLNLFRLTGDIKYKIMADFIYEKIVSWTDPKTRLILYNNNTSVIVSDLVGMVCQFLVQYGEFFDIKESIDLAFEQINFYRLNGVENDSKLPFHGVTVDTNIKVGPTNWGRGIGWYLIALSSFLKLKDFDNRDLIQSEMNELINTLNKLKTKDGVWSQFPGSSKAFDSSATTMIMYSINCAKPNYYSMIDIMELLGKYLDKKGTILYSSGETKNLNVYSNNFSKSEFSQGILLMLLSTAC